MIRSLKKDIVTFLAANLILSPKCQYIRNIKLKAYPTANWANASIVVMEYLTAKKKLKISLAKYS